jgi:hypothetical protein
LAGGKGVQQRHRHPWDGLGGDRGCSEQAQGGQEGREWPLTGDWGPPPQQGAWGRPESAESHR